MKQNFANGGTPKSHSVYEKLNIKSELNFQVNERLCQYLLIRYWLIMHSEPLNANELEKIRRYTEVARILGELEDDQKLQQLCAEVPELEMLVKIFDDMENNEPTATTQTRCFDCINYSGLSGNKSWHVMCAVNIPRPTLAALRKVRGSLPDAWHDCPDFEHFNKIGAFNETTGCNRCYSFEFDS